MTGAPARHQPYVTAFLLLGGRVRERDGNALFPYSPDTHYASYCPDCDLTIYDERGKLGKSIKHHLEVRHGQS